MSERFLIKFEKGISKDDQQAIVNILEKHMKVFETPDGVVVETVMNMSQLHDLCHGMSGFAGVGRPPTQNDDGEVPVHAEFPAGTLAW